MPAEREHVLVLGERRAASERHAVGEARIRRDLLDPRQLVVRGQPGLAREAPAVIAGDARRVLGGEPRRDGANLVRARPAGRGCGRDGRARECREGYEHERQGHGSSHTSDATGTRTARVRCARPAGALRERAGGPISYGVELALHRHHGVHVGEAELGRSRGTRGAGTTRTLAHLARATSRCTAT